MNTKDINIYDYQRDIPIYMPCTQTGGTDRITPVVYQDKQGSLLTRKQYITYAYIDTLSPNTETFTFQIMTEAY